MGKTMARVIKKPKNFVNGVEVIERHVPQQFSGYKSWVARERENQAKRKQPSLNFDNTPMDWDFYIEVNRSTAKPWKPQRPLSSYEIARGAFCLLLGTSALVLSAVTAQKARSINETIEELKPKPVPSPILGNDFLDSIEEKILQTPYQIKQNYKTNDFSKDSDEVLLARMIFGEARNCSDTEKAAVAYTVMNRTKDGKKWNGTSLREVILCPWQYSCFNKNDPNSDKLKDPERYDQKAFENCLQIARQVISGETKDPTNGATHYFNPNSANPSWAKELRNIGRIKTEQGASRHQFYSTEQPMQVKMKKGA